MAEFTPHEQALMERMTAEHRALMSELTAEQRKSMEKISPADMERIMTWIGTDEEIEDLLFWDRWGKFDDPEWLALEPLGDTNRTLYAQAKEHIESLRKRAVRSQRKSDLSLHSQFNDGLLYTGLAPALRCGPSGEADERGQFFRGVEFRLVGSVSQASHTLTIWPLPQSGFQVHLGPRKNGVPSGVAIYTGDYHSALQLAQLIERRLAKLGLDLRVTGPDGSPVDLAPRDLMRASRERMPLPFGKELVLHASRQAASVDESLQAADLLVSSYYDRFGLEVEAFNLGKVYGNFCILRDDNFDDFFGRARPGGRGLVLLTATLVCRRCRRELAGFRNLARDNPGVDFALVNLNSPQFKFYERVFGDMGGGNPDDFRKNAAGVTPFIILYGPARDGLLKYVEYYGTGKADASPTEHDAQRLIDRHLPRRV